MIVCVHGSVDEYCQNHDMVIAGRYEGEIEKYQGVCPVLVTDQELLEHEYYFLKGQMFARGVELISTRYTDAKLNVYTAKQKTKKTGGRQMFGLYTLGGKVYARPESMAVVDRILSLRDEGKTLREISRDERVHHPDGRKLSTSTIQVILNNREKYENYRK